ncbi:DEAD/DEAH box helicase family protein [Mycoplasmopsis columbinasalis]|uniref:Type III restriction enzyme, res subunit n=1 Tax=Mycoplasmopsis columbinasalis TaxID=114880 RepID=A0A449BAE3_9BACT|nr:DEAD/DEAH box helicase family protein [Mycoplasmopsis columbinasalis]VEU78173.1 Type III restriction enzyme, res subunit [Mycoplasmopsis columbinasalis]
MSTFELSTVQERAVNELFEFWRDEDTKHVTFKAPTGSGKTFMIAKLIERIISAYENHNYDKRPFFLFATLSSAELPKQLENKLNQYRYSFTNDINLRVKYVESPSSAKQGTKDGSFNLMYNDCDVMIVGKSSFGKGRIYTEMGYLEGMLDSILRDNETELIYIRDEAHVGTGSGNSGNNSKYAQNFESLVHNAASFTIHMTATPKEQGKIVEISEADLADDNLILLKKEQETNPGFDEDVKHIDDIAMLDAACRKFKEIKERYGNQEKEPGLLGINPAMLIQIRNSKSSKVEEEKKIDEELEKDIAEYIKVIKSHGLT